MDPDRQVNVEHFIPSVSLRGTRAEKLHTLDVLLRHLQQLRASIAEDSSAPSGEISPAPRRSHVTWRDVRVAAGMLRRNLLQRGHSS